MPRILTAIVNGEQVSGWTSGSIQSSLVTPADSFVMRMPFSLTAWNTLRRDSHITVQADGITLLDGFIDKRVKRGKAGMLEINGRDRAGRLTDESAPTVAYEGLTVLEAAKRLCSPWFAGDGIDTGVILSNAKNRRIRRGKGRRVASGSEPVVTFNVRVTRRGNVHPGETRWQLLKEILSRANMVGYSSSDGKAFIIGKPNQTQAPQYLFQLAAPASDLRTTVRDMTITEDDGDRFSMYVCGGVGGQGDLNYGKNVVDNRGVAFDNSFNKIDGTGRDFIHRKIMYLPERAFDSYHDAANVATNEQARRDYKRHQVSVECDDIGQALDPGPITLFAPDTIARVVDEELKLDDLYVVVSCSYDFSHDNGDWSTIHLVPTGTEIII